MMVKGKYKFRRKDSLGGRAVCMHRKNGGGGKKVRKKIQRA